jgi:hypothetical protein
MKARKSEYDIERVLWRASNKGQYHVRYTELFSPATREKRHTIRELSATFKSEEMRKSIKGKETQSPKGKTTLFHNNSTHRQISYLNICGVQTQAPNDQQSTQPTRRFPYVNISHTSRPPVCFRRTYDGLLCVEAAW